MTSIAISLNPKHQSMVLHSKGRRYNLVATPLNSTHHPQLALISCIGGTVAWELHPLATVKGFHYCS